MTRAQQTISIAMILTSVRRKQPLKDVVVANWGQIYLAVFMEVVSFPEKIQKEVVPVVRPTTHSLHMPRIDVQQ